MHVLIIGSGTGGMCLAHGLKQASVSVAVYERDRTRSDGLHGYRVGINPIGNRALQQCLPRTLFATFIQPPCSPSCSAPASGCWRRYRANRLQDRSRTEPPAPARSRSRCDPALFNADLKTSDTPASREASSGEVMSTQQAASKAEGATQHADRLLAGLLAIDLLLFAGGAVAHSGIPILLGFGTWEEPLLVPAAIIEGVGAAGLLITLVAIAGRAKRAYRICWWVLWYCFAGVLWGMARLAMGSIPEAHTMTNDFLHIGMTLVTALSLVRLASVHPGRA